ncbi:MAG TPA: hypothetical protein PK199_07410 [Bacteroidales bacterium]|nr:hypothetical protein [Bacteroidales bacterium]
MKLPVFLSAIALIVGVSCTHECTCVTKINGEEMYKEVVQHKGRCKELNTKTEIFTIVHEYTCER